MSPPQSAFAIPGSFDQDGHYEEPRVRMMSDDEAAEIMLVNSIESVTQRRYEMIRMENDVREVIGDQCLMCIDDPEFEYEEEMMVRWCRRVVREILLIKSFRPTREELEKLRSVAVETMKEYIC